MANIITSKTRGYTGSKASPAGKGPDRRPSSVTKDEFDRNWERTFGKKDRRKKKPKNG